MRLNNKGVTLVELLVSVLLLTVIMGFMYKLLLDVTNMQNNDTFASKNQLKRNEMLKTIENDLIKMDITDIQLDENNSRTIIKFINNNNEDDYAKILINYNNYFVYQRIKADNTKSYKWHLDDEYSFGFNKIKVKLGKGSVYYSVLFDIEVYTENDRNSNCDGCKNNLIDDIIISYTGRHSSYNIDSLKNCIGAAC